MQFLMGYQTEKAIDVTAENAVSQIEEKLENEDGDADRYDDEEAGDKSFSEMPDDGFHVDSLSGLTTVHSTFRNNSMPFFL